MRGRIWNWGGKKEEKNVGRETVNGGKERRYLELRREARREE